MVSAITKKSKPRRANSPLKAARRAALLAHLRTRQRYSGALRLDHSGFRVLRWVTNGGEGCA